MPLHYRDLFVSQPRLINKVTLTDALNARTCDTLQTLINLNHETDVVSIRTLRYALAAIFLVVTPLLLWDGSAHGTVNHTLSIYMIAALGILVFVPTKRLCDIITWSSAVLTVLAVTALISANTPAHVGHLIFPLTHLLLTLAVKTRRSLIGGVLVPIILWGIAPAVFHLEYVIMLGIINVIISGASLGVNLIARSIIRASQYTQRQLERSVKLNAIGLIYGTLPDLTELSPHTPLVLNSHAASMLNLLPDSVSNPDATQRIRTTARALLEQLVSADQGVFVALCNRALNSSLNSGCSVFSPEEDLTVRVTDPDSAFGVKHLRLNLEFVIDYLPDQRIGKLLPKANVYMTLIDVTQAYIREAALQEHIDKLNSRREQQNRMFSIIGHELRTPLASIKMITDELQSSGALNTLHDLHESRASLDNQPSGTSVDALLGFVPLIHEAATSALNIVEDVRTVIDPDKVVKSNQKEEGIYEVIRNTVELLKAAHANKPNIQIELAQTSHPPLRALFNVQAVRQIITNLVNNAVLHSGGSRIVVHVDLLTLKSQASVILRIDDDGVGIDPTDVNRLFGIFERGISKSSGTGLGLHITRKLARSMGGDVHYEPSAFGGSSFVVSVSLTLSANCATCTSKIPASKYTPDNPDNRVNPDALQCVADACSTTVTPPAPTKPSEVVELHNALTGLRVLFAEDAQVIQVLSEKLLTKAGAVVTCVSDGQAALDAYHADPTAFDIIVTDYMMPKLDGTDLTYALRHAQCTLPIFAVTAAVIGEETERLYRAGVSAVLSKPLDIRELQMHVSRHSVSIDTANAKAILDRIHAHNF